MSGETRTVKTPSARGPLFPLFSCNGQPVIALVSAETACRLIARKSSARPNSRPTCGFFADLPETDGQPQRRAVIVVEIRRPRAIMRFDRDDDSDDDDGYYVERGKKGRPKRAVRIRKEVHRPEEMGAFASSGLLLARHRENVVVRRLRSALRSADNRRSLSARINHIDLRMTVRALAHSHSRFLRGDNSSRACRRPECQLTKINTNWKLFPFIF